MMMSLADGAWEIEADATPVAATPPLRMLGFYLRLDIGGGGFFWREFGGKLRSRR